MQDLYKQTRCKICTFLYNKGYRAVRRLPAKGSEYLCAQLRVFKQRQMHTGKTLAIWAAYGSGFCLLQVSINNLDAKLLKDYSWDLMCWVQVNKPRSQVLCSHCCRNGIISRQIQGPASSWNPSAWELCAVAHHWLFPEGDPMHAGKHSQYSTQLASCSLEGVQEPERVPMCFVKHCL